MELSKEEKFLALIREKNFFNELTSLLNDSNGTFANEPIPRVNENQRQALIGHCERACFSYYESYEDKAVHLFLSVINAHPLDNGNKRMGVVLLITFCYVHSMKIQISEDSLYNIAKYAASNGEQSKPLSDDCVRAYIKKELKFKQDSHQQLSRRLR